MHGTAHTTGEGWPQRGAGVAHRHMADARRRVRARGMTMVEVLLATLLLAMIGAVVSSVLSQVQLGEQSRAVRLNAYEVANRLLLQYVDDAKVLDPYSAYVDPETGRAFRWTVDELPLSIEEPPNSVVARPERKEARNMLDATVLLDARVYEAVEDGVGGYVYGRELARLTRAFNPMPLTSANPDALRREFDKPDALPKLLELMTGSGKPGPRVGRDEQAPRRAGGSGSGSR